MRAKKNYDIRESGQEQVVMLNQRQSANNSTKKSLMASNAVSRVHYQDNFQKLLDAEKEEAKTRKL